MKSREIGKLWNKQLVAQSPIHTANALLEPGHWEEYDPFLLLMEDKFMKGAFDKHPHRGMETVTYIIDGVLEHYDSEGNGGRLEKGDIQWMTAGSGVIHLESPPAGETVHSLQLWVNLPSDKKMTQPRTQQLQAADVPVRKEDGVFVRVYSGSSGGQTSSVQNYAPITMLEMVLEPGASFFQELPETYNGFLYILEGSGMFGGNEREGVNGQVLWLGSGQGTEGISLRAGSAGSLRLLLYAGEPLKEPVVARGPFVMNTEREITQAFSDYRNGTFVAKPQ